MPPFPGEERLVTLYADCHYYFAQPTIRPALHRFDKGSYFYIYWNATRQTSRLEIANNAGTPDQDAFNGHLDTCRITYSHRFPTRLTLTVDAIDHAPSPTSKTNRDPDEWRLSSADPKDVNQMKYRLHTIDFYFWTQENSKLVIDFFKKLLYPAQLDLDEPQEVPPQQQHPQQNRQSSEVPVSPVVQNLEQVAISDPAYRNGQTRNSQNQPQSKSQPTQLPPPPPSSQVRAGSRPAVSPAAASPSPVSPSSNVGSYVGSNVGSQKSPKNEEPATNFAPMAYNPAAPAAPEKIAHREKTPPPEDGAHGTGLSAAATHDQIPVSGYTPSQSWGAPPARSQVPQSSQWGSPPPVAASNVSSPAPSSMGYASPPPPTSQYQPGHGSVSSAVPSFAPPPTSAVSSQDPHRHSTAAETYTPEQLSSLPNVETPGTEFYSTIHQPQKPLSHVQPQYADYLAAGTKPGVQPPPGGYSDYSYAQNQNVSAYSGGGSEYDIHHQAWRPTEAEAGAHGGHRKPSRTDTASSSGSRTEKAKSKLSWIEKRANKLKDIVEDRL